MLCVRMLSVIAAKFKDLSLYYARLANPRKVLLKLNHPRYIDFIMYQFRQINSYLWIEGVRQKLFKNVHVIGLD